MSVAEKIVQLNENKLYEDIQTYLNELETHSKETRISFEAKIREFFMIMKNKDIEFLTEKDLIFRRNDILKYRQILLDKGNKNNTVNTKISAIKNLFENLKANEYKVNTSIFKVKRLKENVNSYGSLSQTEAERFAEVALTESTKPYLKNKLILFAIRTSFRLSEILSIKWSDFEYHNGVYKVSVIGKGNKKNTTSISEKLYKDIEKLKEENKKYQWNGDPDIVFQISKDAINDMMKRIRKKLNISKERNITFHSFRGVAIDFELETTGDIKRAAQQGNHSNISTTYKHYINKSRDYTQTAGVRMDEEICYNFLDHLTLDDFKEFIKKGNHKLYMDIRKYAEEKQKKKSKLIKNV